MIPRCLVFVLIVIASFRQNSLPAATLPHTGGVIGEIQQYRVREGESLIEIARSFDLGFNAITAANPDADPIIPEPGSLITIPTAWILPSVNIQSAIVINIPEFRLYYLPSHPADTAVTYPLGIGDEGKDTPTGTFTVIDKIANPSWHVPDSIRAQDADLPAIVPPGPDNPMGSHALRLSLKSVLIHGTNRPWGIGRRSSHGCLRLYPEDIVCLYRLVAKGTPVVIVNQPIKIGASGELVFVEVHGYGREPDDAVGKAMHLLSDRRLLGMVDFAKLRRAVIERRGFPIDVTLHR